MSKLRALTMPKWGIEMAEGTIAEWRIKTGDRIKKTQVIALIETDKIANDLESEFEGTVAALVAAAGQVYPVGALLGVIATQAASDSEVETFVKNFRAAEGSAADASAQSQPPAAAATAAAVPDAPPPPPRIPADANISPAARRLADSLRLGLEKLQGSGRRGRITLQDVDQAGKPPTAAATGKPVVLTAISDAPQAVFASPYARRVAQERGVDLSQVKPTGARGRISRGDVIAAAGARPGAGGQAQTGSAASPAAAAAGGATFTVERFSPMRKAIARQLTLSKSTIPHFYLRVRARMDALGSLREQVKQSGGPTPSINDYLVRASALALREVPEVNVQVHAEEIHRYAHADIAVAVATDRGLITPIVRAADTKPVAQIAAEIRGLAERARAGKLKTEEYSGGTFCISNLGMFGVDEFEAIINPPQGAILAVGAMRRQCVEEGSAISFANMLVLSLSCDHRAIDGAVGARFLAALKSLLENPQALS